MLGQIGTLCIKQTQTAIWLDQSREGLSSPTSHITQWPTRGGFQEVTPAE